MGTAGRLASRMSSRDTPARARWSCGTTSSGPSGGTARWTRLYSMRSCPPPGCCPQATFCLDSRLCLSSPEDERHTAVPREHSPVVPKHLLVAGLVHYSGVFLRDGLAGCFEGRKGRN